jgi:hypothetical protein
MTEELEMNILVILANAGDDWIEADLKDLGHNVHTVHSELDANRVFAGIIIGEIEIDMIVISDERFSYMTINHTQEVPPPKVPDDMPNFREAGIRICQLAEKILPSGVKVICGSHLATTEVTRAVVSTGAIFTNYMNLRDCFVRELEIPDKAPV